MAAKKKAVKKASSKRAAKETKEEQVEVIAASLLGGNMPKIKDLSYHLSQISGYQDKARTAAAKVTEAKKRAKESGIDINAIMDTLRMQRLDMLDLATELKQKAALMSELGFGVQIQLFEPKYGSIDDQAAAEGSRDGSSARTPNTERWPEGTPGSVSYMRAWNDAQASIVMNGANAEEG